MKRSTVSLSPTGHGIELNVLLLTPRPSKHDAMVAIEQFIQIYVKELLMKRTEQGCVPRSSYTKINLGVTKGGVRCHLFVRAGSKPLDLAEYLGLAEQLRANVAALYG